MLHFCPPCDVKTSMADSDETTASFNQDLGKEPDFPLPVHQEYSQLLSALQDQQAEHERRVEQMLERQLEHLAQLVSRSGGKGQRRSQIAEGPPTIIPEDSYTSTSAGQERSVEKASCVSESQERPASGAQRQLRASIGVQSATSEDHGLAPAKRKPGKIRTGMRFLSPMATATWRPSVKSITQLVEAYAKDEGPETNEKDYCSTTDCLADLRACRPRALAQKVTRHRLFEFAIQFLIIANGVILGVQQDWIVQNLGLELSPTYYTIDLAFALCFAFELLLRIVAAGSRFLSCWNPDIKWNVCDSLLVGSAILEILLKLFTDTNVFDVSAGRLLRLLRLVRVVRVLRVFRFFKDLRIMVLSIMGSLRPLGFALLLLGILIYVTAVCFLQFVTDELVHLSSLERGREQHAFQTLDTAYGSLAKASYTLFKSISGGVSWGEACQPLLDISPVLGIIFILYIAFSVFCVLNIITGIFVEEATAMTAEDEENMLMHELQRRKRFINEAKRFFEEADQDGSGELSWPEFQERLQHVRMQKLLDNLGIDVVACGAKNVFELLDFDGNGAVAINEFTSGLQQLRGNARSIDIAGLRYEQRRLRGEVEKLARSCKAVVSSHSATRPHHAAPAVAAPAAAGASAAAPDAAGAAAAGDTAAPPAAKDLWSL